jgi:hypothetical protein
MGGLYNGNLASGNSKTNYDSFISFFPKEYSKLDIRLKSTSPTKKAGFYYEVRCGLTHEYFIDQRSKIVMHAKRPIICGIIFRGGSSRKLKFVVEKYFDDFKGACDQYAIDLISNQQTTRNFRNALSSVSSALI